MASKSPKKTPTPAKKKAVVVSKKTASVTGNSLEDEGAKITLLAETNPKREGTAAHGRFGLYKTGMTVAEFLAAGGTRSDLRWDSARKFVRIN